MDDEEAKRARRLRRSKNPRQNSGDRASRQVIRGLKATAGELAAVYGEPTDDTDPAEVLLQEIQRTAGHIQWLAYQLSRQMPEEFVHGLWLMRRASGYIGPKEIDMYANEAAGAIWVELYLRERSHLASICRTALAAGIEERRLKFAERMGERIGDTMVGILEELGIDTEDDHVRSVIHRHLIAASDTGTPGILKSQSLVLQDNSDHSD